MVEAANYCHWIMLFVQVLYTNTWWTKFGNQW